VDTVHPYGRIRGPGDAGKPDRDDVEELCEAAYRDGQAAGRVIRTVTPGRSTEVTIEPP
jgi:hypothetical protein